MTGLPLQNRRVDFDAVHAPTLDYFPILLCVCTHFTLMCCVDKALASFGLLKFEAGFGFLAVRHVAAAAIALQALEVAGHGVHVAGRVFG